MSATCCLFDRGIFHLRNTGVHSHLWLRPIHNRNCRNRCKILTKTKIPKPTGVIMSPLACQALPQVWKQGNILFSENKMRMFHLTCSPILSKGNYFHQFHGNLTEMKKGESYWETERLRIVQFCVNRRLTWLKCKQLMSFKE